GHDLQGQSEELPHRDPVAVQNGGVMNRILRGLGFAFFAWLLPFASALCKQPIRRTNRPLFESLMGVALATWIVVLFAIESRRVRAGHLAHATRVSAAWIV